MRTLVVFVLLLLSALPNPASGQEEIVLGVHPYLPATELVTRFAPLADYLSRELSVPVRVEISPDYKQHIELVGGGRVDIAYMGPASYVRLVDIYGRLPILAGVEVNGRRTFRGMIIAAKVSPVESISELRGKRFAFGDPESTMSHLVPRYMLLEAGITLRDLEGFEFVLNHENVALGVLVGSFDAGAVKEEVFYEFEPRGLKLLAATPEISEHLLVARKGLPKNLVKALRLALLSLKDKEEGKTVMTAIKSSITEFVAANDEEYDALRRILRTLEKQGAIER